MATDTTSTSPACASDSNANAPASATAPREHFASRLGFILISAGCAIGLGNVWRFPFITGAYGGAAFVLIYLVFLVILGLPIMVMEFSVGRAAKQGIGLAFRKLASVRLRGHHRLLRADDVLYDRHRVDAVLLLVHGLGSAFEPYARADRRVLRRDARRSF